jgi:hypothetical protein
MDVEALAAKEAYASASVHWSLVVSQKKSPLATAKQVYPYFTPTPSSQEII